MREPQVPLSKVILRELGGVTGTKGGEGAAGVAAKGIHGASDGGSGGIHKRDRSHEEYEGIFPAMMEGAK